MHEQVSFDEMSPPETRNPSMLEQKKRTLAMIKRETK